MLFFLSDFRLENVETSNFDQQTVTFLSFLSIEITIPNVCGEEQHETKVPGHIDSSVNERNSSMLNELII
jgi:hypothetical protein